MGHERLGWIPKTKKWRTVVDGVIGGGGLALADVGRIANASDARGAGAA